MDTLIMLEKSLLVVKDKHGTYYFRSSTIEELHNSCMFILMDRLADGWYYGEDKFQENIKKIVDSEEIQIFRELPHSYLLLESRSDYEYEKVELEFFTDIT